MKPSANIVHEGSVTRIANDVAVISFTSSSACAGCSIHASCGMAESTEKTIEVPMQQLKVREGDPVIVRISEQHALVAVLISYFIPFLVVLIALVAGIAAGLSEATAGIIALASLVPCYGLLRLLSRYFKNNLSFDVEKQ